MAPPAAPPIGLQVARTAKALNRGLDAALAGVGSSLATWQVLVSLKAQRHGMQRELAESLGIEGPTLTHHLHRMEADGLVTRTRDAEDRRAQIVALTPAGEAAFVRLRTTVAAFDRRLRTGLDPGQVAVLGDLLTRLRANIGDETVAEVPA